MKNCRKKYKYTLIEMLAVIAIIVIVLTVVLPGFMKAMEGDVLLRAGRTLSGALQKARAEAIISRQSASVIFYDDNVRQYIGVRYHDNAENATIIKWNELPKDVKIAYVASAGVDPFFNYNPSKTENNWLRSYSYPNSFGALDPEKILWKQRGNSNKKSMQVLTFSQTGKLTLSNNLYFGIVNNIEIPSSSSSDVRPNDSVKLELNHFTGEVKWIQ